MCAIKKCISELIFNNSIEIKDITKLDISDTKDIIVRITNDKFVVKNRLKKCENSDYILKFTDIHDNNFLLLADDDNFHIISYEQYFNNIHSKINRTLSMEMKLLNYLREI